MPIIYYIEVTSRETAIEALPEHLINGRLKPWSEMGLKQQEGVIQYLRVKARRISLYPEPSDKQQQQIQRIKAIISYLE